MLLASKMQNQSYELRTTQINKWSYKELELDLPLQFSLAKGC